MKTNEIADYEAVDKIYGNYEPTNEPCLADIELVLNKIGDHDKIGKNHGWFLKEVMRKRIDGITVRAIAEEYGIPITTFANQSNVFISYVRDKLKEEGLL